MLEPGDVKASVVDIVRKFEFTPQHLAIDANVLYFFFYPNFRNLWDAGGGKENDYRPQRYGAAMKAALAKNVKLFTSHSIYGEFLKTMEFADLEILRRTDVGQEHLDEFTSRECKEARYLYRTQMPRIRSDLAVIARAAKRLVDILPNHKGASVALEESMKSWIVSLVDYGDAVLIAAAELMGISHIMSDDGDLITHPGLTVYTANRRAVTVAREAGRLLNS